MGAGFGGRDCAVCLLAGGPASFRFHLVADMAGRGSGRWRGGVAFVHMESEPARPAVIFRPGAKGCAGAGSAAGRGCLSDFSVVSQRPAKRAACSVAVALWRGIYDWREYFGGDDSVNGGGIMLD